jgi:hypothetical protein
MGEVIAFAPRRSSRRPAPPATVPNVGPSTASPAIRSAAPSPGRFGARPEPLWRDVAGAVLREERQRQHRTLAQIADRAGMSVQYLSELERGRKEASSEMLAAACGSLGLSLGEFARRCAGALSSASARPTGPVLLAA